MLKEKVVGSAWQTRSAGRNKSVEPGRLNGSDITEAHGGQGQGHSNRGQQALRDIGNNDADHKHKGLDGVLLLH